jgi:threonine dehydratase
MNRVIELSSLADGLAGAVEPGAETIAAIHGANDMRLVTEDQIADAIRYCYKEHDQMIEGSGAVSVALFLSRQLNGDGNTVALVTGGNIDEEKFKKIVDG